tara:strand:+ start:53307 stop:53735 length:429 start_codon:yes stop_codon:yes gene_type:complete
MLFKSRKDPLYTSIVGAIIAFLFFSTFYFILEGNNVTATIVTVVINAAVGILLTWMLMGTSYIMNKEYLRYKAGPIKGKIALDSIRQVKVGKTLYVGLKPATARNGIVIYYNKYDEIYISPKSNSHFVEELKKLNPSIEVLD